EVSLVVILDADKEGFLRNVKSLIQTIGRAARNENGQVIMYADTITKSMEIAITETNRRRAIQMDYNKAHNIVPKSVHSTREDILARTQVGYNRYYVEPNKPNIAADPIIPYMRSDELNKLIKVTEKKMYAAAEALDFMEAARLKEELSELRK